MFVFNCKQIQSKILSKVKRSHLAALFPVRYQKVTDYLDEYIYKCVLYILSCLMYWFAEQPPQFWREKNNTKHKIVLP